MQIYRRVEHAEEDYFQCPHLTTTKNRFLTMQLSDNIVILYKWD